MERPSFPSGPDKPGPEPESGLFRWIADFDNPAVVKITRQRSKIPGRILAIFAAIGSAAALIAVTIIAVLPSLDVRKGTPANDGSRAVGTTSPPPNPTPSPAATAATPSPRVSNRAPALPDRCEDLFGRSMEATFREQKMTLETVMPESLAVRPGSGDKRLAGILAEHPSLDCFWLDANEGEGAAVMTVATEPGDDVTKVVEARLKRLGFTEARDARGVRFFVEATVKGKAQGESHYLRDGVWLATTWYGFGPLGYTKHMAANVFD